jgi:hypothetical protein
MAGKQKELEEQKSFPQRLAVLRISPVSPETTSHMSRHTRGGNRSVFRCVPLR